ncbi:MAG: GNAT family N-acetyltransferase [Alphaproteobacteria bacterium]|nr:GNAT family N-acetyltransferase [Alphaproteobacteria bacterium]
MENNIFIRKLALNDKPQLDDLIKKIESSLPHHDWWLPIPQEAYDHFFDESWTLFCGAFDKEKLIGASALFFNEFEYGKTVSYLHLPAQKIAEIGRCMVLPDYRGKQLMFQMNEFLLNINPRKIDSFVATAHPDNISSIKSLEKSGFIKQATFVKFDMKRNIYLKKA